MVVNSMDEVIVLIPTKNEEAGVKEVIERVPNEELKKSGARVRIIVVDGRSTDNTVQIALDLGAEVISQSGPKGKGNGVREAFDSIISETTLIVYGKSSYSGKTGLIALWARFPCPISLRPVNPILPTSPTQ